MCECYQRLLQLQTLKQNQTKENKSTTSHLFSLYIMLPWELLAEITVYFSQSKGTYLC